jgi:hypothetical protein
MTVFCIYIYENLLYTKMYLSRFKNNSVFRSYDTNKSYLFISSQNTKLFEKSIAYNSVLICNKRSHEIKSITRIIKFKKMIC